MANLIQQIYSNMGKTKESKPKVTVNKELTIRAQIGTQYVTMTFDNEGVCNEFLSNVPKNKNVKQFRTSIHLINTILDRYEKES